MSVTSFSHTAIRLGHRDVEFAERLRAVRLQESVSQEELAERMATWGHSFRQQTIAKIENCQRRATYGEAVDLAGCLGYTIGDFAEGATGERS